MSFVKNVASPVEELEIVGLGSFIASGSFFEIAPVVEEFYKDEVYNQIIGYVNTDKLLVSLDGVATISKSESLDYLSERRTNHNNAGVSSINSESGGVTITSTDSSLTITTTDGNIDLSAVVASGDLAGVTVRRTTTQTAPTAYVDLFFDSTIIENDTTVLEHNDTNTDRIDIKETGLYLICYSIEVTPTGSPSAISSRVRINDNTVILQSEGMIEEDNEDTSLTESFLAYLTAGDFISLQYQCSVGTETLKSGATMSIARMRGTKGDKGDTGTPGSGSSIAIADEGTDIANTPHTKLNFIGGNVSASDAGGGTANINVSGNVFGTEFDTSQKIGQESTTDNDYVRYHRFTTLSLPAGTYRIGWTYAWRKNSTNNDFRARVIVDEGTGGETELGFGGGANVHTQEPKDSGSNQRHHTTSFDYITFGASGTHNIDLEYSEVGGGTSFIYGVRLEIWRVS